MAAATITAKTLAAELTKTLGRNVSPKQVRALARGDSKAPVLARFADDAYTAHLYTAAEATKLRTAFVASAARRATAPSNGAAVSKATVTRKAPRTPKVTRKARKAPTATVATTVAPTATTSGE